MNQRTGGILLPLFSMASSRSWGIGEFLDFPAFASWLTLAGQSVVQVLPITELPEAESSPYSALTAMALDPIFITLPALEDFDALGGEAALPDEDRRALDAVRGAGQVRHGEVRELKFRALRRAYQHFAATLATSSQRASRFHEFVSQHDSWLHDYALFQALRTRQGRKPWWEWPKALASRDPHAIETAELDQKDEISFRKYLQWIADEQWVDARRRAAPVRVFGDVPFMISADSPDVWTRQNEFRFDGTVGVPPDAFSETGQDWGLPPWRWDVMSRNDFAWMRGRAARTAQLFDGFRLDHLVGLYRTYIRPLDPSDAPFFAPSDEPAQLALGETLVSLYAKTGAEIIAEDLGTVPDYVRASLRKLRIPGFKVLRWERAWQQPNQPFIDPTDYDEVSVATTGTHDTEPLVTWWSSAGADEQAAVRNMPSVRRYLEAGAPEPEALLRALLDSRSQLTIIPMQDVFGWPDRINTPAQVSDENWSWILPWRVDRLCDAAQARERARALAHWTRDARRY